jgi:hypothetical protein
MEANTSTKSSPEGPSAGLPTGPDGQPAGVPAGLERLAGEVGRLLGDDPNRLGGALAAAQVLALELLEDQLAAAKLHRLAVVDAQGAAGAERGV